MASAQLVRLGPSPVPPWLSQDAVQSLSLREGSPFERHEYARRKRRACEELERLGADAIVVFRSSSVEYLCGYHTIETVPQPLIVGPSLLQLLVPDPEVGRALVSSNAEEILFCSQFDDALKLLAEHLERVLGMGATVAIEPLDPTMPHAFAAMLLGRGLRVVYGDFLIERIRLVLSEAEVSCMERAGEITGGGIAAAVEALAMPGATDSSAAAAARAAMAREADSGAPLGVIVATGWRGGVVHSNWNGTAVAAGTTTFLEMSGAHHRYCAPLMRTVAHGPLSVRNKRLAELAHLMLERVLEEARAGEPCSEVASRVLDHLGPLEDWIAFHFTLGYPVGLAHSPTWMDGAPFFITRDNPRPLELGMAFHVPASFRAFGESGVGLSHTILVTEQGGRALTPGPAEVIEL
ncbi:MAG: Xaa-Pro peptidase family protein [Actinomycetota bacterium]|nr:Xaa-Pro peptidase family protein [Actinomycetota bacterium]